jgi:hypothetical protein
MDPKHSRLAAAILGCASLFVLSLFAAGAQTSGIPERFTATAVDQNGRGTTPIEIVVTRWSTDSERDRLLTTLLDKGPEKLLEVLQDSPRVGYIRSATSTGWDLHYARRTPLPDRGERIVVATDRPLGFWEQANQLRTVDYPFTVVELRLNGDGEGEGKLSRATKIIADKESGNIVLENYGLQPVMLQAVRREHSTH